MGRDDLNKNPKKLGKYSREYLRGLKTCLDEVKKEVKKHGWTMEEFHAKRTASAESLNSEDAKKLKAIRETIPQPDEDTIMQKAITKDQFDEYLTTIARARGFITRAQDTNYLINYMDFYKILRLDYDNSPFKPHIQNSLYIIKFKSLYIDKAKIPYSKKLGGNEAYEMPCTGNGFTSAKGDHVIPEFKLDGKIEFIDGAEIYEITKDGKEYLRAEYDEILERFVPVKN